MRQPRARARAGEIAGEVALDYSLQEQIAKDIIEKTVETRDSLVFNNFKRVLNHFYTTDLWNYIISRLKKRTKAFRLNPSMYIGTALYDFCTSHQFGDTQIDRVLALLC